MRGYAPEHDLVIAKDLATALTRLADNYQPIAGGTDLMVVFNAGRLPATSLVSVRRVRELAGITITPEWIDIGAAVTYSEIRDCPAIRTQFRLMEQAAGWTGGIANQNRGTLGGNIVNASPAADSAPVLLVYGARLKLVSKQGERWMDYSSFHSGYKTTALRPGELVATIRLSRSSHKKFEYGRKVGARRAMAISKVSFAAIAEDGLVRVAVGSVAPVPLRCVKTEAFLASEQLTPAVIEKAKAVIRQEISPIDDIRSTVDYRAMVTENLLGEFLESML